MRNGERAEYDRRVRESILKKLREKEGKAIKSLLNNKGYKKYLASGDKIRINEEKIKEAEIWDDIWVLRTNEEPGDLSNLVERYKELGAVERIFRELKNVLNIRPIWHWNDKRIKGHIYCCFLSLLLGFIIKKETRNIGVTLTYDNIIEELKDLRIEWLEIRDKKILIRDKLTKWQIKLFKKIRIKVPPSIIEVS